jgi:signal transduction histidine kinase/ActR/RegA family two-component response regulator
MNGLFAHPLTRRFALGAALLLMVAGVGVILFTNQRYRAEQRADAGTQAAVVAASTVAALDFGDRQSAAEYLTALSANPRVVRAELRDRAGALFVAYARSGVSAGELTASGSAPVLRNGETIGRVTLMVSLDPWWRRLSRYSLIVLLGISTALVVAVLAMGQAALARANDHLSQRAAALADANAALATEIAERGRAEEELRQAQKMQALGQLTGGIAHDFNNLLTVVRGTADLLRRPGLAEARRIRYAESIAQTAERAAQLTSQLLAFSRRQPLQPKVIDLNARLQGMLLMFTRLLGQHYEVTTDFDPELCHVEVDPAQLEVAVLNLVVNARDAMGEGGALSIATSRWPREDLGDHEASADDGPGFAAISITDSGIGMDAETVARAMEPFFTTKTVGKGTGLGLSQVYGFAVQSGGALDIDSVPGRGTTVRLRLPCTKLPVEPSMQSGVVDNGWRGRILFVEDNADVAAFSQTLLEELGHKVLYAQTAEAALELTERGAPFDLVFSDIVMPGMSGFDLAEQVQRLRPGTPILLATGYSERLNGEGSAGLPILAKPYSLDELATAIARAIGANPDSTPSANPEL